jgi:hypothetical protein
MIPDDLFGRAERLARKMNLTRSGLFSADVSRHAGNEVTEDMNATLAEIGDQSDPFMREIGRRVLERTEW